MLRIRRELSFIIKNIGLIGFSAFICAFFGIILWVNGNNIWYITKMCILPEHSPDVTGIFIIWLAAYGLCGAVMALVFLQSRCCAARMTLMTRMTVAPFAIASAVYLFCLIWYALFFNTSLTIFAFVILFLAFLMTIAVLILMRHGFAALKIALILIATVELYFIYFSLSIYLLN